MEAIVKGYNEKTNKIVFFVGEGDEAVTIAPEALLDALDECLLMKVKNTLMLEVTKMDEYIKRMEGLAEQSRKAETGFDLQKIKEEKNCLAQIRYAVKLLEMTEDKIKNEILERRLGEG